MPYDSVKIENPGVLSGVISSTESESENHNVSIFSNSFYDSVAYVPVKTRLSETEAEAE